MTRSPLRVLFLCTGNAARSQMGEAILRSLSNGKVDALSAGTHPQGQIHHMTRQVLEERYHVETMALTPKRLDQFVDQHFDVVITVCDQAAESCPIFPNAAQRLHWNFEDPALVPAGPVQKRAFEHVADGLARRIRLWLALPEINRRVQE